VFNLRIYSQITSLNDLNAKLATFWLKCLSEILEYKLKIFDLSVKFVQDQGVAAIKHHF